MAYKKPSVNIVDIDKNGFINIEGCKKYCNLDYGLSDNMCFIGYCAKAYCASKYTV